MITALEIIFNVLLGVGTAIGYFAMGVHVAHRQFEIFVKDGMPREAALSRSRHLIIYWASYVMIDGIRAVGALIDGKICDVPLTEAEREAQIKRLEIDTGILDQMPVQGDQWMSAATLLGAETVKQASQRSEDKALREATSDMAKNAVMAGLCGYHKYAAKVCLRPVDALHHHEGEHQWATVGKRQR